MADEFTKAALYWIKTFNKKVKEKIWMEKLIELLNEWSKTAVESKCNWTDVYDEEWVYFLNLFDRDMTMEIEDVISKRNWFIEWLVENDKIDREQFYDKARKIITDFDLRWEYEWACNEIIMLLSISDTPIEDLISLLKKDSATKDTI